MKIHIEPKHINIIDKILAEYDFSFFAFGSRVTGKNKKFSDLDIFYFEDIPNTQILKLEEEFEESDIPFKVDVIDFKKCDHAFQKIILKNYLCIKSSRKLKIIEQNHLGHFIYLPKNLGFDLHETNGITLVNCGIKTSMFNIVYGVSEITTSDIDLIKRSYNNQPFVWWIPPSLHNPDTAKFLLENGFMIEGIEHAMICDLENIHSFTQKTNLLIKQIINKSMLVDFIDILKPYDPYAHIFYELINNELLQGSEKFFVGYLNEKPVNICSLFISGDSAGIFNLVTSEDFQKKGYGTDMVVFLMKIAKDHGCKFVTLSASKHESYQIYARLGFSKIGEFQCFEYKENL